MNSNIDRRIRNTARCRWIVAALCCLLAYPAMFVHAQPAVRLPMGIEETMRPEWTRRDLQALAQDLALSQDQMTVVEQLFAEYEQSFAAGAAALREAIADMRPRNWDLDPEAARRREAIVERMEELMELMRHLDDDDAASEEQLQRARTELNELRREMQSLRPGPVAEAQMQQMMAEASAAADAWRTQRQALGDEFVRNVMAVLDDAQQARWPQVERRQLRRKALGYGRLSGESVDLIRIVDELALDEETMQTISLLLQDYELQLDEAIRRRNEMLEQSRRQLQAALEQGDVRARRATLEQEMQARIALRDVNDRFAESIAAALPEALGEAFTATYRARAYPRIFRATPTQRQFAAAKELPGLDADTAAAIADLGRAYDAELQAMNVELLQLTRLHEPTAMTRRGMGRAARGRAADRTEADMLQEAFARRQAFGERYVQQLHAMLTPEQVKQLPPTGMERQGGFRGRGDRGSGGRGGRPMQGGAVGRSE